MNDKLRLSFRRGDLLAILLVALIAAAVLAAFAPRSGSGPDAQVQVFQNGALVRSLPLSAQERVVIGGEYENVISIADGRVSIVESSCPGGDCMRSGRISAPGRSIVCLPNRVEVRISGASEVDFVVR